jgi:Rrf2 family protein
MRMKLSRARRYALFAVAHLGAVGGGRLLTARQIARALGLPEQFLPKLLKPLAGAGVLVSKKGTHGGYRLARPASSITVLEVVEAVGGPIRGQSPFRGKAPDEVARRLQAVCDQAAAQERLHLGGVRLSDLAGTNRRKKT